MVEYANDQVNELRKESSNYEVLAEKRAALVTESEYWTKIASYAPSSCASITPADSRANINLN